MRARERGDEKKSAREMGKQLGFEVIFSYYFLIDNLRNDVKFKRGNESGEGGKQKKKQKETIKKLF